MSIRWLFLGRVCSNLYFAGSVLGNVLEAHAGLCTRNCARMTTFLLVGGGRDSEREKCVFRS